MNNFVLITSALCIFFLSTQNSQAALNLSPGLWEVKSSLTAQGKAMPDHRAQMQKAFETMPPEKRKAMEEMMAARGMSMPAKDGAMRICLTKDMLNREDVLTQQQAGCETSVESRTDSKMVMNFKCKNGSQGRGEWNLHGTSSYEGKMEITTADGKKSEIAHAGKFVSTDCGSVKPLTVLKPSSLKQKK